MGIIHVKAIEGKKTLVFDHVLIEKVKADDSGKVYGMGEIIVPPKAGPPMHKHEAQETFYILDGEFVFRTIEDGKVKKIEASKGDVVHVPSNVEHTFSNQSDKEARLLGLMNPTGLEEFFEKIGRPYNGEPLVSSRPSVWQMLKIGFLAKRFGVKFVK